MRKGDELRRDLRVISGTSQLQGRITEKQMGYMNGLLGKLLGGGQSGDVARHQFLEYVFGNPSSKELTKADASAVIDWLTSGDAGAEAYAALEAWGADHGQMALPL